MHKDSSEFGSVMKRGVMVNPKWFLVFILLLNLFLALYSTPITNYGDAGSYIGFGKLLSGEGQGDFAHRSPLYPLILAVFMSVIPQAIFFKFIVFFQYFLVGLTTWLVCLIFKPLFDRKEWAMLVGLCFNLSLSTIYYANIFLTEILTVFLLCLSLYILFKIYDKYSIRNAVLLGLVLGLLSLARFNTVPLIVPFLLLLLVLFIHQKIPFSKSAGILVSFFATCLIVINIWCYYNFVTHEFYGLFPGSGSNVPRNAVVASIRPDDAVSEENRVILDIFLRARQSYLSEQYSAPKGSLSSFDKWGLLDDLYSGYAIYGRAMPDLKKHLNLTDDVNESAMGQWLVNFYNEIYNQNKAFIMKMRFLSFLSSFRASASALPGEFGKINTNILPAYLFKIFKLFVLLVSMFVFFSFFIFIFQALKDKSGFNFRLFVLFIIVFSFWGINFYFVTGADANRFKFPAEPLIFGLFVYYFHKGTFWLSRKCYPKKILISTNKTRP